MVEYVDWTVIKQIQIQVQKLGLLNGANLDVMWIQMKPAKKPIEETHPSFLLATSLQGEEPLCSGERVLLRAALPTLFCF